MNADRLVTALARSVDELDYESAMRRLIEPDAIRERVALGVVLLSEYAPGWHGKLTAAINMEGGRHAIHVGSFCRCPLARAMGDGDFSTGLLRMRRAAGLTGTYGSHCTQWQTFAGFAAAFQEFDALTDAWYTLLTSK